MASPNSTLARCMHLSRVEEEGARVLSALDKHTVFVTWVFALRIPQHIS